MHPTLLQPPPPLPTPAQSLSYENNLSAVTKTNEAEEAERGCQWGCRRAFVVGGVEGQEVEGNKACVLDKWTDRCGRRVRQQVGQSPRCLAGGP